MKNNSKKKSSTLSSIMISTLEVEGGKYIVKTECSYSKNPYIFTQVFRSGKILIKRQAELKDSVQEKDRDKKIMQCMLKQHQVTINSFRKEEARELRIPDDYLKELKGLVKKKNKEEALDLLEDALAFYPDDPFLLSYHGCLNAIVNKNHKKGVETCKAAFTALKEKIPFGEEFFLPVLHLNLGRAYLASGAKGNAVGAFKKGLELDNNNSDLLWEMENLGVRKKPAVPLLERSNPINKYIGMLLHKISK